MEAWLLAVELLAISIYDGIGQEGTPGQHVAGLVRRHIVSFTFLHINTAGEGKQRCYCVGERAVR